MGPIPPLKVMHISTALSWRGGEQQLAYLIEGLAKKKIDQLVVCPPQSALFEYCGQHRIPCYANKKARVIGVRAALKLKKWIRQTQPALLHTHDAKSHTYAFLASLLSRCFPALIVSRKVDFPIKTNVITQAKYRHRNVKKIICVSNAIKNIVYQTVLDQRKITTVYDGICLDKFTAMHQNSLRGQYAISPDLPIIGCVAALVDHKDPKTFVQTAQRLKGLGVKAKYVWVGEGALQSSLIDYVKQCGVHEDVIFAGFRPDVPAILPEFDVFLLTSKTEGLCQSLLEAMASGVPVVATHVGGVSELIAHNQTGLLSPAASPDTLARHVMAILSDPSLQQRLVEAALVLARGFSKEVMTQRTLQVYQQVVASERQV